MTNLHINPRAHHPETQRGLMPLDVTSVTLSDSETMILDTSIGDTEQLYLWGVCFQTSSTGLVVASIKSHDEAYEYMKVAATANAAFNVMFPMPVKITRGEGIQAVKVNTGLGNNQLNDTVSQLTLFYTRINQ